MLTMTDRVQRAADDAARWRIEAATGARIRRLANDPRGIARRLRELDREWDVERILAAQAAVVVLAGLLMALRRGRPWVVLPGLASGLFPSANQGWSLPLGLLRWLGVRTSREIDIERVALRILRGDFDGTRYAQACEIDAGQALAAART